METEEPPLLRIERALSELKDETEETPGHAVNGKALEGI
jgi:hypothetical protein